MLILCSSPAPHLLLVSTSLSLHLLIIIFSYPSYFLLDPPHTLVLSFVYPPLPLLIYSLYPPHFIIIASSYPLLLLINSSSSPHLCLNIYTLYSPILGQLLDPKTQSALTPGASSNFLIGRRQHRITEGNQTKEKMIPTILRIHQELEEEKMVKKLFIFKHPVPLLISRNTCMIIGAVSLLHMLASTE